jgi:hypothetical protein
LVLAIVNFARQAARDWGGGCTGGTHEFAFPKTASTVAFKIAIVGLRNADVSCGLVLAIVNFARQAARDWGGGCTGGTHKFAFPKLAFFFEIFRHRRAVIKVCNL